MNISYFRVIDINYQKIALEKWKSTNQKTLAGFAVCSPYSPILYVYVIFKTLILIFLYFFITYSLLNIIDL